MPTFYRSTFTARTPDAAEERLHEVYGSIAVRSDDLRYTETATGDSRFALATTRYDGAFSCAGEVDAVVVNLSTPGCNWDTRHHRGELSSAPTLFQPADPLTASLDHVMTRTLQLAADAFTDSARAIYADDRLALRSSSPWPASSALARTWTAAYELAATLSPRFDSAILRAQTYRLLVAATLETFQLTDNPVQRRATAAAQLNAYTRAIRFIDDHASLPITLDDIARAAAASAINLELAFRAHSPAGRTPLQHLRLARLSLAHQDLIAADPFTGATVAAIGQRWGFPNPSLFARYYRNAYGYPPSWTLRD